MTIFLAIIITMAILVGVYFLGRAIFGKADDALQAITDSLFALLLTGVILGILFLIVWGVYSLLTLFI